MIQNYSSDDLDSRINQLLRGDPTDISAYITKIKEPLNIKDTKAVVHCHMLSFDGNDNPRYKDLAKYLSNIIIDYAIPRSQIKEAQIKDLDENTTRHIAQLKSKAKSLFTTLKKTGEGGEMLLYVLAQYMLGLPQILCKMSLKTDGKVHYQGSDGLHIKYDKKTQKLALYWGESKMYANFNDAIKDCLDSIKPYLISDDSSANDRDLNLFRENIDVLDGELEDALLDYLNPESVNFNSLNFRGICMIGFDEKSYPQTPNTKTEGMVLLELQKKVKDWENIIEEKIINRSPLDTFTLEIFLVPFPAVQSFRDEFLKEVNYV